jgi:hypothetical protein
VIAQQQQQPEAATAATTTTTTTRGSKMVLMAKVKNQVKIEENLKRIMAL